MNGSEDFERVEPLPQWQAERLATLIDALGGISLGARERESLTWLAGFELATVENVAEVMRRARAWSSASSATRATSAFAREADRYRHQLIDLCRCEGIDPGEDPHAALRAHLLARGPASGEAAISVQVDAEKGGAR